MGQFNIQVCPYGASIIVPHQNAINPCVIELAILLNSFLIITFGSWKLYQTVKDESFAKIRINKLGKLAVFTTLSVFAQALILFERNSIPLLVNTVAILFIALPLTYIQYFKKPYSAGVLLFYFLFSSFLFGVAALQSSITDYNVANGNISRLSIAFVNALSICISLTVYFQPVHEVQKHYLNIKTVQANAFSRLTFSWMNELVSKGYKNQKITEADLPDTSNSLNTKKSYEELKKVWDSQKKKSLLAALMKVFGLTVVTAVSYETLDDILQFASPQLLRLLIKFFSTDQPVIVGFLLAGGLFSVSLLCNMLFNKFFILIYEAGLGAKGALTTLIYQKALTLSPESKKERSTGDIINIMSVDVSRVQDLTNQFYMLISAPTKLVLCLISLYSLLGVAAFAGVVTMLIMIPINTILSQRLKSLHKTQMKYKDERTRTTSELLASIKSIKLYAIEAAILEKLNHVRNNLELANLQKISIFTAFMAFSWNCVPFLVSCSSFAVFAIVLKRPLTPDIVFPAIVLFDLLADPINFIPTVITALIETAVSFERITKFLTCEEIDAELSEYFDRVSATGKPTVEVENCTFLWSSVKEKKEENYDEEATISQPTVALKVDNFIAKKGELTCIVGKVGSGKSTFLQSILGNLPCQPTDLSKPKHLKIHGSIAYCSQVPWIMNASVKDNILFGHRYDEEFYQKTIEHCQLTPDLQILPDGDETQVGEKGVSLSGGQKARLGLARAVYSRADIYLLDDVLSAVDAHVGKSITEQVLEGLLSTKTIVLATNSVTVLSHSDSLILLENGNIVESGTYKDIIGHNDSKLASLISEYGNSVDEPPSSNDEEEYTDGVEKLQDFNRRPSGATLRRASVATFKRISTKAKRTSQGEESAVIGKVDLRVYKEYAKACSIFGVVVFLLSIMLSALLSIASNYWLKTWSESNERHSSNKDVYKFIGIYALLELSSNLFNLIKVIVLWVFCSIKGSKVLHDKMIKAVVRSPMSFFETTPTGRIINRFSSDLNKVDEGLPRVFSRFFKYSIQTIFTLGFIAITLPSFSGIILVLSAIYIVYQRYYINISRDLKRIVNIARSPVFSHLQETLNGVEIIKAFKQQSRFMFLHLSNLDFNIKTLFVYRSINRWLSIRLSFIGSLIIFSAASLSIMGELSSGMAGLIISYALSVTSSLSFIVRMTVEVETNVVSVERVLEFCDLKPEAPESTDVKVPEKWPAEGSIKFDHYCTKYRENLDPVLNDVTLDIKPQEKVGIVGRTGAGKSTLSLALFRLIEPTSGTVWIDGVDISKIGLHDLRSNIAIIPQDSQAFEGTVRQNLDPLLLHEDVELWRVLELAHLKSFIQSLKDEDGASKGLEAKISEGGSNLSVGQRQLLCLARALLNPSKVLILDEATASVDVETDKIVQETIRKEFKDRTILTIAHRIDTVLDSDKIIVLDKGLVKEFDTPANLLAQKDSIFYSLCSQGGYLNEQTA